MRILAESTLNISMNTVPIESYCSKCQDMTDYYYYY